MGAQRRFSGTDWLAPASVFLLTIAVFLPALQNGFVDWDDEQNYLSNPNYRGLSLGHLRWMFTTFHSAHYQPLSWVTLGLDYTLWGMNPFGYHLTNVLLHALNAAVFFFLARRLLRLAMPGPSDDEHRYVAAAVLSALLFAVHPLRVESVAWISERRDVLSGLFYLLALLAYLRGRLRLAAGVFALSLLSKGMGITLPLTLILLDIYPSRRLSADPRRWLLPAARPILAEKIPFLLIALAAGAIGLWAQTVSATMRPLDRFGLEARLAQSLYGLVFYLWKTVLPLGLQPLYKLPPRVSLLEGPFALSAIVVAAAMIALIALRRRCPGALAAAIHYALALFPVLGLIQFGPQIAADRYSYLPCLGWALLAGAGLIRARRLKPAALALSAAAVVVLSMLSVKQVKIWRDSETLWRHTLSVEPSHGNANINIGQILVKEGRWNEAAEHYRNILQVDPLYAPAHAGLGRVFAHQGRLEEAEKRFRKAIEIDPAQPEAAEYFRDAARARRSR